MILYRDWCESLEQDREAEELAMAASFDREREEYERDPHGEEL